MKTITSKVRVSVLWLLFLPITLAQGFHVHNNEYPYYVIIGAFASKNNAINFTNKANALRMKAAFGINPKRNLYYVYVLNTVKGSEAFIEARRVRRESEFKDAWVYQGPIGEDAAEKESEIQDVNPDTEQRIEQVTPTPTNQQEPVITQQDEPIKSPEIPAIATEDGEGKTFIFEVYRASDGNAEQGEIEVIDTEKSKKIATFKGDEVAYVKKPEGGKISLICSVFGYRKAQVEYDFNSSENEGVVLGGNGSALVPFELIRLQKGDIAVMYNVFFFKDAAIMRPESKYEVNNLLQMLKENPTRKIKIHGHANGNSHGKIITPGGKDFFTLTGSKDGFGSSKSLSEERAKCIRDFLIENGIEENRMVVKAWGGKRPIHDKHSTRAAENVRVEIEILED